MNSGRYEWWPRPPNLRERIIAALFVVAMLLASANSYAGWRLFGDYDQAVAGGMVIVGLILFLRFMPTARRR
jgi:hypothetical protein